MADGPLHAGGRGGKPLGHLRIQHLGDGVDHIHVVHGDHDGLPQVLIALDVGGHTDLMDNRGHQILQLRRVFLHRGTPAEQRPHPIQQGVLLHGLCQKVAGSQIHSLRHHAVAAEGGDQDNLGDLPLLLPQLLEYAEAVQPRQDHIHQNQVRRFLTRQAQGLRPVSHRPHHRKLLCLVYDLPHKGAEFLIGICQQYSSSDVHVFPCPLSTIFVYQAQMLQSRPPLPAGKKWALLFTTDL